MTAASALPTVTLHGGASTPATLLGQAPARIPTAGKIRAGIKVLTKRAAGEPRACEIYERGLRDGHSFDRIEQALAEALPQLKNPLVPRNVPWFTVRAQDFGNPALARELIEAYGEDRGEGRHLYRFPVVFPSDHWQTVMPHELAAWERTTSATGLSTRRVAACGTACATRPCRWTRRGGAPCACSAGARR